MLSESHCTRSKIAATIRDERYGKLMRKVGVRVCLCVGASAASPAVAANVTLSHA